MEMYNTHSSKKPASSVLYDYPRGRRRRRRRAVLYSDGLPYYFIKTLLLFCLMFSVSSGRVRICARTQSGARLSSSTIFPLPPTPFKRVVRNAHAPANKGSTDLPSVSDRNSFSNSSDDNKIDFLSFGGFFLQSFAIHLQVDNIEERSRSAVPNEIKTFENSSTWKKERKRKKTLKRIEVSITQKTRKVTDAERGSRQQTAEGRRYWSVVIVTFWCNV